MYEQTLSNIHLLFHYFLKYVYLLFNNIRIDTRYSTQKCIIDEKSLDNKYV